MTITKDDLLRAAIACDQLGAVDLGARLREAAEGCGWIPVGERLPENKKIVIAYQEDGGYMFIGYYRADVQDWRHSDYAQEEIRNVSHWMPPPAAPEVK